MEYNYFSQTKTSKGMSMSNYKMVRAQYDSIEYDNLPSSNSPNLFEAPEIKIEDLSGDNSNKSSQTNDSDTAPGAKLDPKKLKITYKNGSKGGKELYLSPDSMAAQYKQTVNLRRRVSDTKPKSSKLQTQDVCYQVSDFENQE